MIDPFMAYVGLILTWVECLAFLAICWVQPPKASPRPAPVSTTPTRSRCRTPHEETPGAGAHRQALAGNLADDPHVFEAHASLGRNAPSPWGGRGLIVSIC